MKLVKYIPLCVLMIMVSMSASAGRLLQPTDAPYAYQWMLTRDYCATVGEAALKIAQDRDRGVTLEEKISEPYIQRHESLIHTTYEIYRQHAWDAESHARQAYTNCMIRYQQ